MIINNINGRTYSNVEMTILLLTNGETMGLDVDGDDDGGCFGGLF